MTRELVRDDNAVSMQTFPLNAGGIKTAAGGASIDVSDAKMITFDSQISIQINGVGDTFAATAGSRWAIAETVSTIKVGAATGYILG